MKKVSLFFASLAMVAFVACNNASEEAVVEETVVEETVVEEAPVVEEVVDTTMAPADAPAEEAAM
jgi:hypothetical protein